MTFLEILFAILLILKLSGQIKSWWVVMIPVAAMIIIPVTFWLFFMATHYGFAALHSH